MMVEFHWRLPTHGDRADVSLPHDTRGDWGPLNAGNQAPGLVQGQPDGIPYHDHLLEIARAAELAGFDGGLVPSFPNTDDPWVISAAIARRTKAFKFMIAFQPAWIDPAYAAKAAASLQRLSGGRLNFNIITGGGGPSQLWWGDRIAHDDRYNRTTEFLDVFKGLWEGKPFSYQGKFFQLDNAQLPAPLAGQAFPSLYFAGSSNAALEAQGKHADFNLTHMEPLESLRIKFDRVRELASKEGRKVKPAVRFNILARETEEEAWDEVRRAWANVDWDERDRQLKARGRGDGIGSPLPPHLIPSRDKDPKDLQIDGFFSGLGVLGGQGTPLGVVGSYETAAERIDTLINLGVEGFILAGSPHLEEAYRIGEEVIPLVRGRKAQCAAAAE
ncbi:MAG: LLM class flavin-dependent oxidoreductase [Niveispirillum sp.]|uniref:LLM class flavin-dependent oxidoreductase n=1 Tax=Niveispirillum sp. TaxID=1917217 RepID=UPI0040352676